MGTESQFNKVDDKIISLTFYLCLMWIIRILLACSKAVISPMCLASASVSSQK